MSDECEDCGQDASAAIQRSRALAAGWSAISINPDAPTEVQEAVRAVRTCGQDLTDVLDGA